MPDETPTAQKGYSILIVDDDKFLLDMYTVKFKSGGCQVEAIPDPTLALERLRKGATKPDVILLDVVMPALSGFDVLEAIKKENLAPQASVIMLTNQGTQEDIDHAMKLGAAGYIIKASSIPSEVLQKTLSIAGMQVKQ